MPSIEAQFKTDLCAEATRLGLSIQARSINETFALTNAARGTAVMCFRISVSHRTQLHTLAVLDRFARTYTPEDGAEAIRSVNCVLAGPAMKNQPVDWSGVPTEALG